jgi:hypothetical protein
MKQETLLAVTSQLQASTHNYHVSTPANQEQQHEISTSAHPERSRNNTVAQFSSAQLIYSCA